MIGMPSSKHYSRAPITEALIDLRAELPDGVTLATLIDVHSIIKADYPMLQDFLIVQGQMVAGASVGATASQTQLDIDLGREIELPDTEVAWDVLEQLHTRTNQVFEACITDRTRELIN